MLRWDSNLSQVSVEAHGISLRVYPRLGRGEVLERKRDRLCCCLWGSQSGLEGRRAHRSESGGVLPRFRQPGGLLGGGDT